MGFLKKALIMLKFSSPSYRKHASLCCEYRLGHYLAFNNLMVISKLGINCDPFVKHCDMNFQRCENTQVLHL